MSSLAQEPPPSPDSPPREALSQDDVEVLTRGPVHEAFAEPLSNDPAPGLVVPRKPPEDIAEVAPDFKPEGDDVVWIPGYWAWDDDRDNFLWVSGIWRKLPPGLRWVPGYWIDADADGDWQWVSGLWVPDQQDELVYRQPPPETLETGPSTPAPSDSYFWVPGCWMWYDAGYRWRPGYWHPYQENWVWVPAHWIWTPSGCLFVAGYWDYRVSTRGQLFAPVYFRRNNWYASHYYSPWCVVESTPLLVHFWVRPRYSHYYFGDYYGPRYASFGISPWSHYHSRRGHWDPLLTHYSVHYRHHDHFDYADRMKHWHSHYDHHDDERPRRTFRDQEQFAKQLDSKPAHLRDQSVLGVALATAATKSDRPVALKPVSQDVKQFQFKESKQLRELTRERAKSEKLAKIDNKPALPNTGLVPDPKGKVDAPKVDLPGKAPEPTAKTKSDEPPKNVADKDKDKDKDDQKRPQRGGLKLPKATVTTGKLAAEAPKTPPQASAPAPIERKDLPKVERPKTGQAIGGQGQPNAKNKPTDPRSTPTVKTPTIETPKGQPKVESPKVQPKVEPPKAPPKVEPPKVEPPKSQPKIEPPKVQPKVEPPKTPKVEPPKPQPKIEPPKNQPKVEPPKAQPKPPKVDSPKPPKNEPPKRSESSKPPKKSDDDKKSKGGKK